MDPRQSAQEVVDHLETSNVERYRVGRPRRPAGTLEAIVIEAARVAESRMRLELALFRLSCSRMSG